MSDNFDYTKFLIDNRWGPYSVLKEDVNRLETREERIKYLKDRYAEELENSFDITKAGKSKSTAKAEALAKIIASLPEEKQKTYTKEIDTIKNKMEDFKQRNNPESSNYEKAISYYEKELNKYQTALDNLDFSEPIPELPKINASRKPSKTTIDDLERMQYLGGSIKGQRERGEEVDKDELRSLDKLKNQETNPTEPVYSKKGSSGTAGANAHGKTTATIRSIGNTNL
jgi:hypothetical protein